MRPLRIRRAAPWVAVALAGVLSGALPGRAAEAQEEGRSARTLIVALGDSTTAGTPFFRSPAEAPPDGEGDPQAPFTAAMMRLRPDWKVKNRGVAGERSDEVRARLAGGGIWESQPRALIVLAGVNDLYQGRPRAHVEQQLLAIYREAQRRGVLPLATSVLPFTAASAEQAAEIRRLNAWIEQTAKREKIPFCDLNRVVADPRNPDRLRGSPDGLHPDKASYRAMGEALVACLTPHLGRTTTHTPPHSGLAPSK